jgi:CheY-like chemotaxis protein
MRILLVEDNPEHAEQLQEALGDLQYDMVLASNAASALTIAASQEFDLIICDLKIPASAEAEDPDTAHGEMLFDEFRAEKSGTPIMILSGHGELSSLQDRLADAPREDFLGDGLARMVTHRVKDEMPEAADLVKEHADALAALRDIEITGPTVHELSEADKQVIRIRARQRDGVLVRVEAMGGGRSEASVVRLEIEGPDGRITGRDVAKLNSISGADHEKQQVDSLVSLLNAASYSGLIGAIRAGGLGRAALLYSVGATYSQSLFDVLRESDEHASEVVHLLEQFTSPWRAGATAKTADLGALRRDLVSDGSVEELDYDEEFDFHEVESQSVNYRAAVAHHDLHGGNALVDNDGRPLLIDFEHVSVGNPCIDPVTVELCPLFHPDAEIDLQEWPSVEQARNWHDLRQFIDGCPIPRFVEACRSWLSHLQRAERDRDAAVYSYALSQLSHSVGRREVAEALLAGAIDRLR